MIPAWIRSLGRSLSALGLFIGLAFFAASLTPTLLPRTWVTQGVLSGASHALGYGAGVLFRWIWLYLGLKEPRERLLLGTRYAAVAAGAVIGVAFLMQAAEWQNSIRAVMGLPPVETAHPFKVGLLALATAAVLLGVGRLFALVLRIASGMLRRVLPPRVAAALGTAIAVTLFWSAVDGLLLKGALRAADSSYRAFDELIEPESSEPTEPGRTGSAASLVRWQDLGRAGREFVAGGPRGADIAAFLDREAMEPIRVYVGLQSGETAQERAALALAEMKRVGAFDRSVLVVIAPTGTGWVDPAALDTVEYLHGGDIASVGIQYSYLASWLSLLVEPDYGAEAARALFLDVYGYWTTLPRESRPKLYLHGLSLGAYSSERSGELFEVIADPFQGALWSGPPFPSRFWGAVTAARDAGTPAWLPRFRDGSLVRFTAQENHLGDPVSGWGPMRVVYLQYASDPVTFFDPKSFYRQPDWMEAPRGPDVSPELRWYPAVTMLQLGLDMAMATTTPMGHGHVYAPEHYIDAWVAVTDVRWSAAEIERLKRHFARPDSGAL